MATISAKKVGRFQKKHFKASSSMGSIDEKQVTHLRAVTPLSPASSRCEADAAFYQQTPVLPAALIHPAPVTHCQSKTWKSELAKEREQFTRVSTLLHHFVPKSPFVPRAYATWIDHRLELNQMQLATLKQALAIKIAKKTIKNKVVIDGALEKKVFKDNRSAVLAIETIWCSWFEATIDHPRAEWPDRTELQYEGDDRAKSGVGRFFPLPRKPADNAVNWKAKEQVEQYHGLDQVGLVGKDFTPQIVLKQARDDFPAGSGDEEEACMLLGDALMAELN